MEGDAQLLHRGQYCLHTACSSMAGRPSSRRSFATPLEATGCDSLFELVKCHKLQRKEIGITVPFKKILKPTQTMRGWGQNPKRQWHSFSVKQNVCVFFGGSLHRL